MSNLLFVFSNVNGLVDNNTGVRTDDVGFSLVDLNKLTYQNDPFIMAKQAK